jgi:hypothetical protein
MHNVASVRRTTTYVKKHSNRDAYGFVLVHTTIRTSEVQLMMLYPQSVAYDINSDVIRIL